MALYKSAQSNVSFNEDFDHVGDDEVVIYEEKPSEDDVVEMHQPEEGVEVVFKLAPLPGSDQDCPIEVSTDDPEEDKKTTKEDKNDLQVVDAWDWQNQGGHKNFLNWVHKMFSNIPKHKGETVGIERAVSYLKRLNNEFSKAVSSDYNDDINVGQLEQARKEIHSAIERCEDALEKHDKARKKKAGKDNDIVKEAKQTRIDGIVITVPLLISRVASVCINSMVSAGKDIEKTFSEQVKEYSLDKREQAELMELLHHMGYSMPRRDRGWPTDHKADYTSEDNYDFSPNYPA